jgi:hypothetical protein
MAFADDLGWGAWDDRYGHFRAFPENHGALRLIRSEPH